MVSIAEPINYRIFERKRRLEEDTSCPTPSMPWSQCRTKTKKKNIFFFQADSVLECFFSLFLKDLKNARCGGFNQKIVLAYVSAIWSKKLLFFRLPFFALFQKTDRRREDTHRKIYFWSFKTIKNKKTKATVLLFCSFIFQKHHFFRVFPRKKYYLNLLVHWPEHGRTTRLT